MSIERLHVPDRHALEVLRHHPAWDAVAAIVASLRNLVSRLRGRLPQPDTSIAWEDGEVHDDREARG